MWPRVTTREPSTSRAALSGVMSPHGHMGAAVSNPGWTSLEVRVVGTGASGMNVASRFASGQGFAATVLPTASLVAVLISAHSGSCW